MYMRHRSHKHTQSSKCKCVCLPSKHHWQEAIMQNVLKHSVANGEQNQSLCLSWPCLPTGPHRCVRHHTGKRTLSLHTTSRINVQMYARKFQKSQNYWAKWGSGTQIVGIMNNYCILWNFPQFPVKQWLQWFNWEKNPEVVWSYCFQWLYDGVTLQ